MRHKRGISKARLAVTANLLNSRLPCAIPRRIFAVVRHKKEVTVGGSGGRAGAEERKRQEQYVAGVGPDVVISLAKFCRRMEDVMPDETEQNDPRESSVM